MIDTEETKSQLNIPLNHNDAMKTMNDAIRYVCTYGPPSMPFWVHDDPEEHYNGISFLKPPIMAYVFGHHSEATMKDGRRLRGIVWRNRYYITGSYMDEL